MTHIDFWVTRSKIKVTITIKLKQFPLNILSINQPTAVKFKRMNSHVQYITTIDFRVIRSKVRVTLIFTLKIVRSGA
jgi:hypothetical protein